MFSTDKETATLASQASKIIQSRNILLIDVSLCQKQKSQSSLKSQAALLIFTKLFIVAFIYFISPAKDHGNNEYRQYILEVRRILLQEAVV